MNTLKITLLIVCAAVLSACSPRVAQPPPLDELEPPYEEAGLGSGLAYDGPSDFGDGGFSELGGLDQYAGDQPLVGRSSGEWVEDSALETVYFDYDQFQLRDDAMQTLARNGQYLQRNPHLRIRIEGHCDERGTDQYNLALGEHRALSVREYLASRMGIDPNRIEVFSYGEYEPAVQGTGESAWRWNRRAEFKVSH